MAVEVTQKSAAGIAPNGPAAGAAPTVAGPLETLLRAAAGDSQPPRPWVDAGSYPWNDDAFSARFVRRVNYQDLYGMKETGEDVDDLLVLLAPRAKARLLDLCCGNGRHAIALALRGYKMTGVDVGPGAVALARETSRNLGLAVDFRQLDVLTVSFEDAYDGVYLLCGGLSDFSPDAARDVLARAARALVPGGLLVCEFLDIQASPAAVTRSWRFVPAEASLFADADHLQLDELFYDKDAKAEVLRSHVVTSDGATRTFMRCRQYMSEDDVRAVLAGAGLQPVSFATGSAPGYRRAVAKKP